MRHLSAVPYLVGQVVLANAVWVALGEKRILQKFQLKTNKTKVLKPNPSCMGVVLRRTLNLGSEEWQKSAGWYIMCLKQTGSWRE